MMQTMRQKGIRAVMALGFVAATALTAGAVQAASGNGPYYAEPSWSQKLPATTRFVVLTDWNSEAVLDRETGLVWERSPNATAIGWSAARFHCTSRTTGGRKGWRLPSVHELASLIDPSVARPEPTLPPGHPFLGVVSSTYWSATNVEDPSLKWIVLFDFGNVGLLVIFEDSRAWCVRGGMNADTY